MYTFKQSLKKTYISLVTKFRFDKFHGFFYRINGRILFKEVISLYKSKAASKINHAKTVLATGLSLHLSKTNNYMQSYIKECQK